MKAVVQRVKNANVTVNEMVISRIGQGLCVFIGISNSDTAKDIDYMARKILSVKLFEDEGDTKWKKSVADKQYEILCVSQFTLYNSWKGNKPDFHNAMPGNKSQEFYTKFLQVLKSMYIPEKIKDGQFGTYMQVTIQNDGPVTVEIESPAHLSKESKEARNRAGPSRADQGDAAQVSSSRNGEEETKRATRSPETATSR